jgi:hypothetical protein
MSSAQLFGGKGLERPKSVTGTSITDRKSVMEIGDRHLN